MAASKRNLDKVRSAGVDAFLREVKNMPVPAGGGGRLVFALDATLSRQPTWDRAMQIQGEMFQQTAALGGLAIQLCWFRGFGEFEASPWIADSAKLLKRMTAVRCRGGATQIGRLLEHAMAEAGRGSLPALVYIGDCVEEDGDHLCHLAARLGMLGVRLFIFHEGGEPYAGGVFREMARLSGGAYLPFDAASAHRLRDLLAAVAVYATGGRKALADLSRRTGGGARLLLEKLG